MTCSVMYGVIGDGRLAKHLIHYFSLKKIPFKTWSRKKDKLDLKERLSSCDILLFAVKDNVIEELIKRQNFSAKVCVHFSGSLTTQCAQGFHRLASFGDKLFDLNFYERIAFVVEKGQYSFSQIFPSLKNPNFSISSSEKSFYHSMCVLSGNFTAILWHKVFTEMKDKLGLPGQVLVPYMESVFSQIKSDHKRALTGPLIRKDRQTVANNILALKGDPFEVVYRSFVEAYEKSKELYDHECT